VRYLLALAGLLLALSTACSPGKEAVNNAANTAAAQADYCTSLNLLRTDMAVLQALGPTASIAQVKDAANKVQDDVNQLSRDAKNMSNAKTDQVNSAYQNLQRTAQGISDSTTVAAAVATLTPQIAAVNQAENQAKQVSCQ
jgi:hypothetical protein